MYSIGFTLYHVVGLLIKSCDMLTVHNPENVRKCARPSPIFWAGSGYETRLWSQFAWACAWSHLQRDAHLTQYIMILLTILYITPMPLGSCCCLVYSTSYLQFSIPRSIRSIYVPMHRLATLMHDLLPPTCPWLRAGA